MGAQRRRCRQRRSLYAERRSTAASNLLDGASVALEARSCYRDVIAALHEGRVECAVGGAFAIHKHTGVWRTTKDLDLLLE